MQKELRGWEPFLRDGITDGDRRIPVLEVERSLSPGSYALAEVDYDGPFPDLRSNPPYEIDEQRSHFPKQPFFDADQYYAGKERFSFDR